MLSSSIRACLRALEYLSKVSTNTYVMAMAYESGTPHPGTHAAKASLQYGIPMWHTAEPCVCHRDPPKAPVTSPQLASCDATHGSCLGKLLSVCTVSCRTSSVQHNSAALAAGGDKRR